MSTNIYKDKLLGARLFGASVLYSVQPIPREDVPQKWYCYDLRGTVRNPDEPYALVDQAEDCHAGSILSYLPLKSGRSQQRSVKDMFQILGTTPTLAEFCAEENIRCPETPLRHMLRPASPEEAGIFYTLPPEQDTELGCIGHVRMDFGRSGTESWHTWHPRGPEKLNTPEFKAELQDVVDELRTGVLKNFSAMTGYCRGHGGEISGGWVQNYGYIVETERYRYCLRCNPAAGDFQAYLTAFDLRVQRQNMAQEEKPVVGRVTFASGERLEYTDAEKYLQCIQRLWSIRNSY